MSAFHILNYGGLVTVGVQLDILATMGTFIVGDWLKSDREVQILGIHLIRLCRDGVPDDHCEILKIEYLDGITRYHYVNELMYEPRLKPKMDRSEE